jgi:hypothetical protein
MEWEYTQGWKGEKDTRRRGYKLWSALWEGIRLQGVNDPRFRGNLTVREEWGLASALGSSQRVLSPESR